MHLYNDSELIVSTASVLLILAAAYQLPDCLQVLSVGVLRGFRDTASISIITFVSYWMVGFPVCYILARTDWIVPAMGARGVWIGFIVGLTVAAVLLLWRVVRTTRRDCPDAAGRGVILPGAGVQGCLFFLFRRGLFLSEPFQDIHGFLRASRFPEYNFFFPPYSRIMSPAPFLAGCSRTFLSLWKERV